MLLVNDRGGVHCACDGTRWKGIFGGGGIDPRFNSSSSHRFTSVWGFLRYDIARSLGPVLPRVRSSLLRRFWILPADHTDTSRVMIASVVACRWQAIRVVLVGYQHYEERGNIKP